MFPDQSITGLAYDIAWDNPLTNKFHILRYSLKVTAARGLSNVLSLRFCPICMTNFVPWSNFVSHLSALTSDSRIDVLLTLMFLKFILDKKNLQNEQKHIQVIFKILKTFIFDASFKFW